uniref:Dynein regulatory complex protein 9 n=1 Tax=Graphocephala atropunctata TaxID=36148 RepID=A0A1B6MTF3_9HEMI
MEINPENTLVNLQDMLHARPPLCSLESYSLRCVLQKASDKLQIIESLLPGEKAPVQGISYQPLALKLEDVKFKVKVVSSDKTGDGLLATRRVKRIVGLLLEVLLETMMEIEIKGSHDYIDYALWCDNWVQVDKILLKQENREYNAIIKQLKDKLYSCKCDVEKTQSFLLETTGPCLDRAITDDYVQEKTAERLNSIREQTRVEQNFLRLKDKENEAQQWIETQNADASEENRIHTELDFYLTTVVNELQKKLDYWTNRYNSEIEKLDVDLLQTSSKMEELKKNRQETLQEFNMKKEKILKLQIEADEHERLTKRRRAQLRAAVTIQRWWRRFMYKRGLKVKLGKGKKNVGKKK